MADTEEGTIEETAVGLKYICKHSFMQIEILRGDNSLFTIVKI